MVSSVVSLCFKDVVGCIQAALHGDVSRSRKQVINQIMKQGLASDRKRLHKNVKKMKKVLSAVCTL